MRVLRGQAGIVEADRDPFGEACTIVRHTFLISGKEGRVLAADQLKVATGHSQPESMLNPPVVVADPIVCETAVGPADRYSTLSVDL